jgi:hypothetical protein
MGANFLKHGDTRAWKGLEIDETGPDYKGRLSQRMG